MKTKKLLLLLAFFISAACSANAQVSEPVKMRDGVLVPQAKFSKNQHVAFDYVARKTGDNEGSIDFVFQIKKGWRLYALTQKAGCPLKTTIVFDPSDKYDLIGGLSQPYPVRAMDKNLKMEVRYYENTVIFTQKVKLKPGGPTGRGTVTYVAGKDGKIDKPVKVPIAYIIM